MCLAGIYWSRINRVCYSATRFDAANVGFDDEFIYEELNLKNNQKSIALEHFPLDGFEEPFIQWNIST